MEKVRIFLKYGVIKGRYYLYLTYYKARLNKFVMGI